VPIFAGGRSQLNQVAGLRFETHASQIHLHDKAGDVVGYDDVTAAAQYGDCKVPLTAEVQGLVNILSAGNATEIFGVSRQIQCVAGSERLVSDDIQTGNPDPAG
jgi:hypothetical protein